MRQGKVPYATVWYLRYRYRTAVWYTPMMVRIFLRHSLPCPKCGPFRIRTTRTRISQANDATHRRRRRDEQLESTKRLFNTGGRNTLRRDLGRRLDLYLDARELLVELADLERRERLEEACVE